MFECYEFEECEYNTQPKCCLPSGMQCPHGMKAQLTNADRIRAMSDEELADRIWKKFGCPDGKTHITCGYVGDCKGHWLDWLQQPAEEDT